MAAEPQSIFMNSADLIKKEPLDYGGFGEVFLCYHKTHGQVVLKTVYTGPPWKEGYKQSLMEEGNLMLKLNHKRIVKLLGVILENGAYSLVMELIPKGNLMSLLQEVNVPLSIKGRIILEILEGMVYLTEHDIIHKDLKPENILVDKDFHIKIADLGLATYQSWSRLTKEESRRKSRRGDRSNIRTAGTLFYMAPEHLESIHTRSSEKSDVYSFAIVVWVILTTQEPYENARNEDQVCQCVRNGDRPDENAIPPETPEKMAELMRKCWRQDPEQRPTFAESYKYFQPFYREDLEKNVEKDSAELMAKYEGPDHYLKSMRSLSLGRTHTDSPTPLRSSDSVPIEASIEDLGVSEDSRAGSLQTDAGPIADSSLKSKLDQELGYHQHGSYSHSELQTPMSHQNPAPYSPYAHYAAPLFNAPMERGVPRLESSVQSWSKNDHVRQEPAQPLDSYNTLSSSTSKATPMSPAHGVGIPPVSPFMMNHPFSLFQRLHSNPANPTPESEAPDFTAGNIFNMSAKMRTPEAGNTFIHSACGVQIGSNNRMHIRGQDFASGSYQPSMTSKCLYNELLQQYEDSPVTEDHLDLLRENIAAQWKCCARQLGLTETEMETIDHDYNRDGLKEKVHQMLEKWKMKEGLVGCTMGRLCQSLYGAIKVDLLCRLLQLCQSATSP
ncbi:receptor-interacting serine/threonine-protein kinase 1-like [Conger conger]|nr:receptor-interacting serine/threonine-protein kinase 1-like [Conger conger]